MANDTPRTADTIQAEIDALTDKFDAEEIADVADYKRQLRDLNNELAETKNARKMFDIQMKIVQERNRRVFDQVAQKNYKVTLADAASADDGGGVPFKYFKSKILAEGDKLNETSAQGDEALLDYLSGIAEVVNKETGHDPDKKPDAKTKAKDKGDAKDDGEPQKLDDPEPGNIAGEQENTEQSVDPENQTPGEKAFLKLISGEEIDEFEQATIARDLEFNEQSFRDPGLPFGEMASLYSRN